MRKLMLVLSILVLAVGCPQPAEEPPAEVEPGEVVDTTAYEADTSRSVTWIGSEGGAVRHPSGIACIDIPAGAVTDSVRVTVQPGPPTSLPGDLPQAFRSRQVHPPIVDFSIQDANGADVTLASDATFVICSHFRSDQQKDIQNVDIARAGIALYFLQRTDSIPPACLPLKRGCEPRPPAQGARLGPFGVTAAYAAGSQTEFYGLGGKGRGGSPFAGVKY
jgi:hypothetical protein